MAESGCKILFVGLESFNSESINDMRKFQNVVAKTRAAIELCKTNGILVMSGLMLSPLQDGEDYLAGLTHHLSESGLHVPTFLCFECPLPGTPFFQRLARSPQPAFLPNALLRDFSGYTLVVRPGKTSAEEFVALYRDALKKVYAWPRRIRKLSDDLPKLLRQNSWFAAFSDVLDMAQTKCGRRVAPGRTFIAGTDAPPPESVPFGDDDFSSETERSDILSPMLVTDAKGFALPKWIVAEREEQSPIRIKRMAGVRVRAGEWVSRI
jgi:hypothetical protein